MCGYHVHYTIYIHTLKRVNFPHIILKDEISYQHQIFCITWYLLLTTKYTRFSKVHIPYRAKKSYLDMGVLKKIDFQWENRQIRKIFTWLDTLVGRQFRFTFCDVLTSYASCYYTIYIIRYLLYQLIFYTVIL